MVQFFATSYLNVLTIFPVKRMVFLCSLILDLSMWHDLTRRTLVGIMWLSPFKTWICTCMIELALLHFYPCHKKNMQDPANCPRRRKRKVWSRIGPVSYPGWSLSKSADFPSDSWHTSLINVFCLVTLR